MNEAEILSGSYITNPLVQGSLRATMAEIATSLPSIVEDIEESDVPYSKPDDILEMSEKDFAKVVLLYLQNASTGRLLFQWACRLGEENFRTANEG